MTASQLKVHYFEARIDCPQLHLPLSRSRSQANVAPKVVESWEEGGGKSRFKAKWHKLACLAWSPGTLRMSWLNIWNICTAKDSKIRPAAGVFECMKNALSRLQILQIVEKCWKRKLKLENWIWIWIYLFISFLNFVHFCSWNSRSIKTIKER